MIHIPTTLPLLLSCRRLDPTERPLHMVYDYLAAMGYADPVRVQQEAANSDLSCLIRFYTGEYWPTEAIIPTLHYLLLILGIWLGAQCLPLKKVSVCAWKWAFFSKDFPSGESKCSSCLRLPERNAFLKLCLAFKIAGGATNTHHSWWVTHHPSSCGVPSFREGCVSPAAVNMVPWPQDRSD